MEGAFSEETWPTWWQYRFEMVPKLLKNGTNMAAKLALEPSCRPLGGLLELLKRLGRPRGGFQGLMERSWTPLGSLLGPKKEDLNGSWPLQEEFQDRFQPSWGPKGSRKGGQEGPKSSPRGDSSSKRDFFKKHCFSYNSLIFEVPGSLFRGQNRYTMASHCSLTA